MPGRIGPIERRDEVLDVRPHVRAGGCDREADVRRAAIEEAPHLEGGDVRRPEGEGVRFDLSGGQDGQWEVDLDNGLDPGTSYLAVVHFGKFPVPKSMTSYELTANIYLQSDPDKPLTEESRNGLLITP